MTLALGSAIYIGALGKAFAEDDKFVVLKKTDAEWEKQLPSEQYHILRHRGALHQQVVK